ncbi:MAG: hypothetical protein CME70_11010 [Halobacteriovorax sp.]|nr:hypothetical protein [Halobacteriovorax sp.]|tara:strand:+ start:27668 stop:27850 length:183 start_codon:yes stop_codon:yes gene_type:complete
MLLSKIKKTGIKRSKNFKKSFVKDQTKKFIHFLNRPINEERLREIEEEKVRIQFYYPFIK